MRLPLKSFVIGIHQKYPGTYRASVGEKYASRIHSLWSQKTLYSVDGARVGNGTDEV